MFNFSGKSCQGTSKAPIDIDLPLFWKTADESYFIHTAPNSIENKYKELTLKFQTFQQNHHHGTLIFPLFHIDHDILSHISSELSLRNFPDYSDYFYRQRDSLDSDNVALDSFSQAYRAIKRQENFGETIFGYKVKATYGGNERPEKETIKIEKEEASLLKEIERKSKQNKELIKT